MQGVYRLPPRVPLPDTFPLGRNHARAVVEWWREAAYLLQEALLGTPKVDETFWDDRPAVSAVVQAHKDVAHAKLVLDERILAATEAGASFRELSSATGMAPSWLHKRADRARKLRPEGDKTSATEDGQA